MAVLVTPEYSYRAEVIRWVDGDTVDVVIDLGFHTFSHQRLRLHGIDTPERGQPNYAQARELAEHYAAPGTFVVAETFKTPEKYGRFLARLYVGAAVCINDVLVEKGLARIYSGGAR